MGSRTIALFVAAAAGLAAVVAWRFYVVAERNGTAIRGSGIIEVTQVDVAFEVSGRLIERYIEEGAMLDKGEPVARLDDREYRLQVERAAAAVSAAEARYRLLLKGARGQEIDQALARVEAAEADLGLRQSEHDRVAQLFTDGVVSREDLDRVKTGLVNARAAHSAALAQLDLLREGFQSEEIEEVRARLRLAQKEHELAELNLARCELFAPAAGRVLSKSREPGEMVQPGTPVVTVGDLSRPWVNVYVGERDLGKLWLGMKAHVTVDSFPDQPFEGKVGFISERAEFTPKNIQTRDERVKLVYRVKVELEGRDQALKPGMPADAVLLLDGQGAP
jgi:HlyD family secretion protein